MKKEVKLVLFIILLVLIGFTKSDKKSSILEFKLTVNDQELELGKSYYIAELNDSITISNFKFYVSNITFLEKGIPSGKIEQAHILIDTTKPESQRLTYTEDVSFDHITFFLGIDSLTNSSGAHGGDLDPMHGMYWSWQSGYINLKLEGSSPLCDSRNNEFTFHLGGYQNDDYAMQSVNLSVNSKQPIIIQLPLNEFLNNVDLKKNSGIMSPGKEAVDLSAVMANLFHINK